MRTPKGWMTINTHLLSAALVTQCRDMPPTAFRIWNGLYAFIDRHNQVDVRLKTIADYCKLSVASVQRAMKYFEEHNLIAKKSESHRDSVWMINPELIWNDRDQNHQQTIDDYRSLRLERVEK